MLFRWALKEVEMEFLSRFSINLPFRINLIHAVFFVIILSFNISNSISETYHFRISIEPIKDVPTRCHTALKKFLDANINDSYYVIGENGGAVLHKVTGQSFFSFDLKIYSYERSGIIQPLKFINFDEWIDDNINSCHGIFSSNIDNISLVSNKNEVFLYIKCVVISCFLLFLVTKLW